MELIIEEKKDGRSVVLDLSGDLVLGESTAKLRHKVREIIDKGHSDVSLDLANVDHLDSSGIGELISALVAVQREEGRLVLLNPTDRARQLLEISSLTDIFDVEFD